MLTPTNTQSSRDACSTRGNSRRALCLCALAMGALLLLSAGRAAAQGDIKTDERGEPLITLIRNEAPAEMILGDITKQSGYSVSAEGTATGMKFSVNAKEEPLMSVLEKLAAGSNLVLYSPPGEARYILMDEPTYKTKYLSNQVQRKIYQLDNIPPAEFSNYIQSILTPEIGSSSPNPVDGTVVVVDLPQVLAEIDWVISWLDVKPTIRRFQIARGNADFIYDAVQNESKRLLGQPAEILFDKPNRSIVVMATPSHIKRLETIVALLDIRPVIRSYPIYSVGMEGDDFTRIEEAVEPLLSEDAYWHFDYENHIMILRDIPPVHEDVEQILAQIDRTPAEVLIQAEIIETQMQHGMSYGTDITWSEDLFSATRDGLFTGLPHSLSPSIPEGSDIANTPENLGFLNLRDEFPTVTLGSGGITLDNLSRHARITFTAAMSDTRTQVLQQPRLFVRNHGKATMDIGAEVPFITTRYTDSTSSNYSNRTFTQETKNEGIEMDIEVAIQAGDLIRINVSLKNNKAYFDSRVVEGYDYDVVGLNTQEIETEMIIPNGNTRVIGGLLSKGSGESKNGIPFLKDIPLIGGVLFGSTNRPSESNYNRMLMIFVTPYVIRPEESVLAPEPLKEYHDRRIEVLPQADNAWGQGSLREQLSRQWDEGPQIADREPSQPDIPDYAGLDDLTSNSLASAASVERARFRFTWANVSDVAQGVKQRLTSQGSLDFMSDDLHFLILQDTPESVEKIHRYLVEEERRAARAHGYLLDDIDSLDVDLSVIEQAQVAAADDRFDPYKAYTNYKVNVGAPKGEIAIQPSHIYSINQGRSQDNAPSTDPSMSISAMRDARIRAEQARSGQTSMSSSGGPGRPGSSEGESSPSSTSSSSSSSNPSSRPSGLYNPSETSF
ncbi:hypothetical protein JXA32_12590 [Candidatus Sumerlaeota bacterium]|nr:hypothetical protein [Candidatus Sumerlaeota bacterium]